MNEQNCEEGRGDSNAVNGAPGLKTFAKEFLKRLDMRGGEGGGGHDAWSGVRSWT